MRASEADIVVVDFESTGAVPGYREEPWQIGLVRVVGGRVDCGTCYTSLLNVGERPFNRFAPGRHEQLRTAIAAAPTLASLWPTLRPRMAGAPIAGHNVATERKFLSRAFPLLGASVCWLDTLRCFRKAMPGLASYKLEALLEALSLAGRVREIVPEGMPHDALYDATAAALLLEHLLADARWGALELEHLASV